MKTFWTQLGRIVLAAAMVSWSAPLWAAGGPAGSNQPGNGRVLFDFTDGKAGPFTGGKFATMNGKSGLLVDNASLVCEQAQDWSGYDLLKIDVFNPADDPRILAVEIRDAQTTGYWTRVNYSTLAPPGKSTLTIPTDMYVGEKSRPGRPLIKGKVTFLALIPQDGALLFEAIRLEKLDTASVLFDGLQAFDFGDVHSPVMPGYKAVTAADAYNKGTGYGWLAGGYPHAFDGMQPDALFEDFITAADSKFQVDLPNGKYHACSFAP